MEWPQRPIYTNDRFGVSVSILTSYLTIWGRNQFLEQLDGFIEKSKQFDQSNITSNIATLMLMLSVNEPLGKGLTVPIFTCR